jgi:hypothetical protein
LVVIANQHVAVNTFSGLVHTARQVSKVVYTLNPIDRIKVETAISTKS